MGTRGAAILPPYRLQIRSRPGRPTIPPGGLGTAAAHAPIPSPTQPSQRPQQAATTGGGGAPSGGGSRPPPIARYSRTQGADGRAAPPPTPAQVGAAALPPTDNTGSAARQGRPQGGREQARQARCVLMPRGPSGFTGHLLPDRFRRLCSSVSQTVQQNSYPQTHRPTGRPEEAQTGN